MNTWTIAWYELRRMFRSKSVIINLFLMPLLLIFILGTVFSSSFSSGDKVFTPEVVKVAIVGSTGSETSKSSDRAMDSVTSQLEAYLKSPDISGMIKLQHVETREEAEKKVRAREADYAVIVPSDFDEQVMSGKETRLELILGHDQGENLIAGTVFDNFLDEVNQGLAVSTVMGKVDSKQETDVPVFSSSSNLSSSAGSNTNKDTPSYVTSGSLNESGVAYTASQYYASAMMIMFLLYAGSTASTSLYNEKSNHTLYRLQSLPISPAQIFLGKMVGNSIVAILQATVIITVSSLLFDVDWGDRPLILMGVCLLLVIASMAIGALVTLMVRTSSSADAIMQVIIVGMTFLSGGFTPLSVDFINHMGLFTVSHWGMESMLRIMLHASTRDIVESISMLAVMCLILITATAGVYRKVGYRE
jgi:ABC-2 type transport system permease protein